MKLRSRRILIPSAIALFVAYAAFASVIWWAMHQPPEKFGLVMKRMPGPVAFLIFPFETAWTHARAGHLQRGDPAPDFALLKLDKSAPVRLSDFTAQKKPVVLVFGSYT